MARHDMCGDVASSCRACVGYGGKQEGGGVLVTTTTTFSTIFHHINSQKASKQNQFVSTLHDDLIDVFMIYFRIGLNKNLLITDRIERAGYDASPGAAALCSKQ